MTGVQTCALPICFPVTIDSGAWQSTTNTGTKTIQYTGTGTHTFSYYSIDNAGNTEDTNTNGAFITYGRITFNTYDENTNTALTDVTINDETTDHGTGATNKYTKDLTGTTTETAKLYTISKAVS